MASISISINRGAPGQKATDYTTGTLATNAGDIELRINVLDANSHPVTRLDVVHAVNMFLRQIEGGKLGAFGTTILAP
jgi:hypothetical protein